MTEASKDDQRSKARIYWANAVLSAKRRGKCVQCGADWHGPRQYCDECKEKRRLAENARDRKRRESGKCPQCGLSSAKRWRTKGGTLCVTCNRKKNALDREYKKRLMALGLCVTCRRPVSPNSNKYCEEHKKQTTRNSSRCRSRKRANKRLAKMPAEELSEMFGVDVS